MDISPQQAQEIAEIEKQVNFNQTTGPKVISEKSEKSRSALMNILATLGITVVGGAAVIVLLMMPGASTKKSPSAMVPQVTTTTMQVASTPNIVVTTEYVNPFSSTSQYSNPFVASQNPFAQFTQ